jgi:hypothetical protein
VSVTQVRLPEAPRPQVRPVEEGLRQFCAAEVGTGKVRPVTTQPRRSSSGATSAIRCRCTMRWAVVRTRCSCARFSCSCTPCRYRSCS